VTTYPLQYTTDTGRSVQSVPARLPTKEEMDRMQPDEVAAFAQANADELASLELWEQKLMKHSKK
jgi:hypothetical protein